MRKIQLNMASRPRFRPFRMIVASLLVVILSVLLVLASARRLHNDWQQYRQACKLEKQSRERVQLLEEQVAPLRQDLAAERRKWQKTVQTANSLLRRKAFSFIGKLDFIETLMIDETWIQRLTINNESKGRLDLQVMSNSFEALMRQYEKFTPHSLVIRNESERSGLLQADLQLSPEND